jgi:carbohydrate kinase (thermoresistant glucokinase family)
MGLAVAAELAHPVSHPAQPLTNPPTDPRAAGRPRVVVMGVSGCGKSTVGQQLAERLGLPFVEGDTLHPPENVARMAAGIPLTDEDRWPWLDRIAQALGDARDGGVVVACSALKRAYRDRLRGAAPDLTLIHLRGERDALAARLASRRGHYMPASLLDSQLRTLQPPEPDERAIELDVQAPPQALVQQTEAFVARSGWPWVEASPFIVRGPSGNHIP